LAPSRYGGVTVPTLVVIALGSNLGDRHAHLYWAVTRLGESIQDLQLSPIIETEPLDVPDVQPPYLNAVAMGHCGLEPRALLNHLLATEQARNRIRPGWRAPRTLDLDLILYGARVIDEPGLVVPHPRFRERAFVLEPLVALAPDVVDPVTGATARALLQSLRDRCEPGAHKGRS
jgi:2-amino-4-hydroxy-6-hydroxymethyldihydropteridine diphosphokinase